MTQENPYQISVTVRLRGTQPIFEFATAAADFYRTPRRRTDRALVDATVEEIERVVAEFTPGRVIYQRTRHYRITRANTPADSPAALAGEPTTKLLLTPWQEKLARQKQICRRGYGYRQSEAVDYLDLVLQPFKDEGQRFRLEVHAPLQHVAIVDRRRGVYYDPATLFDRSALRSLRHPDFVFRADIHAIVTDIGGWPRCAAALFLRQRRRNPAYTLDEAWRTLEKLGPLGRIYVR